MIYFIEAIDLGRIKIGYTSRDASSRLEDLRTASPCRLRLLCTVDGDRARERELHDQFHLDRRKGEWFAHSAALRRFISEQIIAQNARTKCVSPKVAAERFGVPVDIVLGWINRGHLTAVNVGGGSMRRRWRIPVFALDENVRALANFWRIRSAQLKACRQPETQANAECREESPCS